MTRLLLAAASVALLTTARPYSPRIPHVDRIPDRLSCYEIAEITTGVSSTVLRGLACAESSEDDNAIGDDGHSVGRYQWHDRYIDYYQERYGYFDPRDPLMSSVRAAQVLADNLDDLGDLRLAIAAHRQGATGVRNNGESAWYVDRVMEETHADR